MQQVQNKLYLFIFEKNSFLIKIFFGGDVFKIKNNFLRKILQYNYCYKYYTKVY